MKKRTYKQMQNRLYREIKHRMILERSIISPQKVCITQRTVETLKVESILPNYASGHEEFFKSDMARKITDKLIADGYVVFSSRGQEDYSPIRGITKIEARLNVVRPIEGGF